MACEAHTPWALNSKKVHNLRMITFCGINCELDPMDWIEDENDLSLFVMVTATTRHELGRSTHIAGNKKHQAAITARFGVVGCFTMKCVSQFDMMIETSMSSLNPEMKVIGLRGLSACLNARRLIPFHLAGLKAIEDCNISAAAGAPTQEEEEEDTLGHALH